MANYKKTLESAVKYQWKAVVKEYPLVAAAVMMGNKNIAPALSRELSVSKEITELFHSQLDVTVATKVGVRLTNCFNNFDKALARAQDSEDVKSATTGLSSCLKGSKDR